MPVDNDAYLHICIFIIRYTIITSNLLLLFNSISLDQALKVGAGRRQRRPLIARSAVMAAARLEPEECPQ